MCSFRLLAGCVLLVIAPVSVVVAQNADDLAKQLANPIATLISVPLQLNNDRGLGSMGNGDRWTLNAQPVVPLSLNSDWNLISRTIVPFIGQHDVTSSDASQAGIGDIVQSVFLSPKAPTASGWIWGAGPALLLPTGRDGFTANRWAAGPTAVALKQAGPWTFGMLVNQLWSVSHDGPAPAISAAYFQPFLSKALGQGVTASIDLESTYDWTRGQWTVPTNITISKVTKIGGQLVSVAGGVRCYFTGPGGTPDWGLRFTFTLLYPR